MLRGVSRLLRALPVVLTASHRPSIFIATMASTRASRPVPSLHRVHPLTIPHPRLDNQKPRTRRRVWRRQPTHRRTRSLARSFAARSPRHGSTRMTTASPSSTRGISIDRATASKLTLTLTHQLQRHQPRGAGALLGDSQAPSEPGLEGHRRRRGAVGPLLDCRSQRRSRQGPRRRWLPPRHQRWTQWMYVEWLYTPPRLDSIRFDSIEW